MDRVKVAEEARRLRTLRKQYYQEYAASRSWGTGSFEDFLIRQLEKARQPLDATKREERVRVLLALVASIADLLEAEGFDVPALPDEDATLERKSVGP